MDCSLSGSSIYGIFQARVLEWIAISFSRGSSRPRNRTWVSRIAADALLSEPPGKPPQSSLLLFYSKEINLFALITKEGFLISPCYSLELCIQMCISFFSFFAFHSSSFLSNFKASSDSHFAFLHFFLSWE